MATAAQIIPGEDSELLALLTRQYHSELRPQGPVETALVDTIVQAAWNRRRLVRIENQLWSALLSAQEPGEFSLGAAFLADASGANALEKIFRRQQAAHREWHKALAELRRLQAERSNAAVSSKTFTSDPPLPILPAKALPGEKWSGSEPPEWRL